MSWSYSSPPPDTYDPRWQHLYTPYPHTAPSGIHVPFSGMSQSLWHDASPPIARESYFATNATNQLYVGTQGYAPAVAPSNPSVKGPETPVTSYSTLDSALSLPSTAPRSPRRSSTTPPAKAHSAPASSTGSPTRRCSHCQTTTTPLWRRDAETLELVCNACGLYQQQHACHRPAHLIAADAPVEDTGPPAGHDGRVCSHCGAYRTSVWRRNKEGAVLCNACGVYLRLKGVDRPVAFHGQRIRPRARGGDKSGTATASPVTTPGA